MRGFPEPAAGPRMSFVLENWYLFATALVSGVMLLWPTLTRGGGGFQVSPGDAVHLINREKAVLIDVSEPAQYAAGHAMGAKNVPIATLVGARELPKNKQVPVVVMCATGRTASQAVMALRKAGYEQAKSIAGGLGAWRAANLPTERSAVQGASA